MVADRFTEINQTVPTCPICPHAKSDQSKRGRRQKIEIYQFYHRTEAKCSSICPSSSLHHPVFRYLNGRGKQAQAAPTAACLFVLKVAFSRRRFAPTEATCRGHTDSDQHK